MTAPTAAAARAAYEAQGLTGAALDLSVRAGAAARHESRVVAAVTAATTAADGEPLLATLLLRSGALGLTPGGRLDCSGARSQRAAWAAGLGTGRRQAGDGPAWDAAIREAGAAALDGATLVVVPDEIGGGFLLSSKDRLMEDMTPLSLASALGGAGGEPDWRGAAALLGALLLRTVNKVPAGTEARIEWFGPLDELSKGYNAARRRVEAAAVARRLRFVGAYGEMLAEDVLDRRKTEGEARAEYEAGLVRASAQEVTT